MRYPCNPAAAPTRSAKDPRRGWTTTGARLIVAIACAAFMVACSSSPPAAPYVTPESATTPVSEPNLRASQLAAAEAGLQTAIVTVCQELVKAKLKAPLTAKFASTDAKPDPAKAGQYTAFGALTSTNLMGVPLGATYDCKYILDDSNHGETVLQDLVAD